MRKTASYLKYPSYLKKRASCHRAIHGVTSHSRFTAAQVLALRARREAGEQIKRLAIEFGCAASTMSGVVSGRRYKHIRMPVDWYRARE